MNKAEIIKGIETTIAGLETIKNALTVGEEAPKGKTATKKQEVMNAPVEETEDTAEVLTGKFDIEQLKSMKYNDFKKLASQLGVKCTGTRDEIMERILALDITITDGEAVVEDAVEEEEEEAPVKKSSKSVASKKLAKEEVDEPTTDEFDAQAEEIAKDTPVEDIIEALADVDIKATKKNAVEKLAQALREGLIELDDEDEEDEEEEVEEIEEEIEEDDDEEEIEADSYFPEFDPNGYNDPDEMTEERAEAIESKMDEILTDYSDRTLSDKEIASYIEDNATDAEKELLGKKPSKEDNLKLYMELIKRTIDNDGEEHEQGEPYEVADKDVCCGHELKYSKKTKMYICEHCGTEYEAE